MYRINEKCININTNLIVTRMFKTEIDGDNEMNIEYVISYNIAQYGMYDS